MAPVSISNTLPAAAKSLMVYFYQLHFPAKQALAKAKIPYSIEDKDAELFEAFTGESYQDDFATLKHLLANMGVSVPTLYKQYSELCEAGEGVSFSAFNIDPDFADCVDGLVVVDLDKVKAKKRKRYISVHLDN